jgi:hypothetical protein
MGAAGCIVMFDKLTEEDFRLLEIRFLLANLGELGLGQQVAKEYRIEREDLLSLALIESECREISQIRSETDEGCDP